MIFFTDGLVENPAHSLETGLRRLAALATEHAALTLQDFVQILADHHPGDGHDDMAVVALRTPGT